MIVKCWVKNADHATVFYQVQQVIIEAARAAALPFAKS